jgi:D-alanyl-D-alanine carboxypeptidase (penicillin-binding protein 5/6)
LTEKGKEQGISTRVNLPDKLFAPLEKGQKVGILIAEQDGRTVGQTDLVVSEDVKKAGMFDILKRVLARWINF